MSFASGIARSDGMPASNDQGARPQGDPYWEDCAFGARHGSAVRYRCSRAYVGSLAVGKCGPM